MARIAGIDIPRDKPVEIRADLYLWHWSQHQPADSGGGGIDPTARVPTWTRARCAAAQYIDRNYQVEGDLAWSIWCDSG